MEIICKCIMQLWPTWQNYLYFYCKKTLKLLLLLPDCWNMDPKEMPEGWKWQEALKHIFKNLFMNFTYLMK